MKTSHGNRTQIKKLLLPLSLASTLLGLSGTALAEKDKAERTAEEMSRHSKDVPNDSWITAKTKIALMADGRISGTRVNVETKKSCVILRGKVDSMDAKNAAAEVAHNIEGVQEVKNELQVVPASKRKFVDAKDDYITAEIEKRIKSDKMLMSSKIDVRSDAGVVTLQGQVPGIQASLRASELADGVEGVRTVKNDIMTVPDKDKDKDKYK